MGSASDELLQVPGISPLYANLLWEYHKVRTVADYLNLTTNEKLGAELNRFQISDLDRSVKSYLRVAVSY